MSIGETQSTDYTDTLKDMVEKKINMIKKKFNDMEGLWEIDDPIAEDNGPVNDLIKRYDESLAKRKAAREEKIQMASDIITKIKLGLIAIGGVANDSGVELLQGMGLMKKPDIFKLILLLDSSLAQFLKKPVNAGVDKQREFSAMGEVMDSSVTGLTGDPYEDCLENGDPIYDANDPEKNPNAATSAMGGEAGAYGVAKGFIDLGKERFNYQYEDLCYEPDRLKLEVFFSTNRDFKFELINLLDALTIYESLSDMSLQYYMQSTLDGEENKPTDSQKKKQKEIEERDSEKAVKKDKENTDVIVEAKVQADKIQEEINKLNLDKDKKEKAIREKFVELLQNEKKEEDKKEKKKISLILAELLGKKEWNKTINTEEINVDSTEEPAAEEDPVEDAAVEEAPVEEPAAEEAPAEGNAPAEEEAETTGGGKTLKHKKNNQRKTKKTRKINRH